VLTQSIHRGDELLLDAEVRIAALRASDFRPRGLYPELFEALNRLVISPGADE